MSVCWFVFFKQKTAYEMRISDWIQTWALPIFEVFGLGKTRGRWRRLVIEGLGGGNHHQHKTVLLKVCGESRSCWRLRLPIRAIEALDPGAARSEERRVGKECVSTRRSRRSTYQ